MKKKLKKVNTLKSCGLYKEFFRREPEYCYIISKKGEILDLNNMAFRSLGYKKMNLLVKI